MAILGWELAELNRAGNDGAIAAGFFLSLIFIIWTICTMAGNDGSDGKGDPTTYAYTKEIERLWVAVFPAVYIILALRPEHTITWWPW